MNDVKSATNVPNEVGARTGILEKLYDAVDNMKKLAPWETFCEVDLCEIYPKGAAEPYYCSLRGMFEDNTGISVYSGHEGLISFSNTINAADLPMYVTLSRKNCMECIWVSREDLTRRDLVDVKLAGKKYRGAGNWPLIRKFQVGYAPFHIDDDEAAILTEVIEQMNRAYTELHASGELKEISEGERIRRSYDEEEERWINEIVAPIEQIKAVTDGCVITDELLLRRLKKKNKTASVLEFDLPFIPVHLKPEKGSDGRSRLPQICIACDADRGSLENQCFVSLTEDPRDIALGMIVDYVENKGRPAAIYVRDTGLFGVLGHLCKEIDVELCFSPMLNMLDFFVEDVIEKVGQLEEEPY